MYITWSVCIQKSAAQTILDEVSEVKWPRFCFCRRPLLFLGHFLVMHMTIATIMAICTAPIMAAIRTWVSFCLLGTT